MKLPDDRDTDSDWQQVYMLNKILMHHSYSPLITQTMKSILSEIKTLSKLDDHENIIAYHTASFDLHPRFHEQHLFIVIDLMEGVSNNFN